LLLNKIWPQLSGWNLSVPWIGPCKVIHAFLGIWIPPLGFQIGREFQITENWPRKRIPDSSDVSIL
jgi:hypothetical protein